MSSIAELPRVWLVGDADHRDFCAARELLDVTASVVRFAGATELADGVRQFERSPDLIVWSASRPGTIGARDVDRLRRCMPLTGMAALLGSWCEGETRTGRPVPGVRRILWYDFPNWWRRQLALLAIGSCPDWAQPATANANDGGAKHLSHDCGASGGLILLQTTCWESGDVLSDVLRSAGYGTSWIAAGGRGATVRGAAAGIWEGRQFDEPEMKQLSEFCRRLGKDGAPVIALADFPRRERCEVAYRAGAAAVMGKPWLNADLLATLARIMHEWVPAESRAIKARAA